MEKKWKIDPLTIPSDSLTVRVGMKVQRTGDDIKVTDPGQQYNIHEGETVSILPVQNLSESISLMKLVSAAQSWQDAADLEGLEPVLENLCRQLSNRVVAWTWTDMTGEPLEQPYRKPEVIKDLSAEEIIWLAMAVQGEVSENRKNGSGPLPGTSSTKRAKSPSRQRA